MRILHTSDWHLGKMLENINRIEEQKEFIDYLCEFVEQENIDLVLIAGDIFDTYNPSSAAEELFYDAMDRLGGRGRRAVVVIAGNHDNPERLCAASPLAYKHGILLLGYPSSNAGEYDIKQSSIKLVRSGPGWLELCVEGCSHPAVIITLPYPSEARLEEVLSKDVDEGSIQAAYSEKIGHILGELSKNFREDTVNLVVSHLYVQGGKTSDSERVIQVGGAMTVYPDALPGNAHFIALGHLHRPQEVKGSPSPAFYSGSPLAYSFSEVDYSKSLYIVDAVPGEAAKVTPVLLNCGRPLKKWVAKGGYEEVLQWCEEGRDQGAWIDVEIHTDRIITAEEQKKLRELNRGILNIRPLLIAEDIEITLGENRETRRVDELFQEFYRHRLGIEASEELMGTFLEILNSEEEAKEEIITGGEDVETKIS